MQTTSRLRIVSARRVFSVERIDAGDTIAVRVEGADGEEVAILAPIGPAVEMARRILEEAAKPSQRERDQGADESAT